MNSFIDYLIEIGIVVNKSALSSSNLLFALSDYFKNLIPSDCFDLAIRIYDCWTKKRQEKKIQSLIGLERVFHKHLKFGLNKLKCIKSRQSQKSHMIYASPLRSKDSSMINLMGLNETCERLYMDGLAQKVKKEQSTQEKIELQLKDCTFKPQITCETMKSENSVFDRLYKTQLIGKTDFTEMKEQLELHSCTFTPQIPKQQGYSSEGIFDRLYKESESRSHTKLVNHREQKELQQCTFKPEISERARSIQKGQEPLHQRLHNESAEKKQLQAFKKLEQDTKEIEKCTFHPRINEPFSPSAFPVHDRLYMLSSKKSNPEPKVSRQEKKEKQEKYENITLYERMKTYVHRKKQKLGKIEQEMQRELTFKPKINCRTNRSQLATNISRNNSQISVTSDKKFKPSSNTLSTYVLNTRKSQQESEKENNVSLYCETAYFQEERQFRSNLQNLAI